MFLIPACLFSLCALHITALQIPLQRAHSQAYVLRLPRSNLTLDEFDVLQTNTHSVDVLWRRALPTMAHTVLEDLSDSPLLEPSAINAKAILDIHASYHPLSSIESILGLWANDWPHIASIKHVATSHEGRPVKALVLSKPSSKTTPYKKLRFLVLGGQHAREWIAPSTVLFLIDRLLFAATLPQNEVEPAYKAALDNFEFVFVPVVNPDGYVYSWATDRLWRKSRQPNQGSDCVGIDLNRNWDGHFQKPFRPNPCSENYSGKDAFESVELKAIQEFVLADGQEPFSGLLDFHSFGQMIMFPFADCSEDIADYENLFEAVIGASKAAQMTHGRQYTSGQICEVSYAAGGDVADWAYKQGIRWSFSCELRDIGTYGFFLPEKEIRPTGEEALSMLLSLTDFIILKEAPKRKPRQTNNE